MPRDLIKNFWIDFALFLTKLDKSITISSFNVEHLKSQYSFSFNVDHLKSQSSFLHVCVYIYIK